MDDHQKGTNINEYLGFWWHRTATLFNLAPFCPKDKDLLAASSSFSKWKLPYPKKSSQNPVLAPAYWIQSPKSGFRKASAKIAAREKTWSIPNNVQSMHFWLLCKKLQPTSKISNRSLSQIQVAEILRLSGYTPGLFFERMLQEQRPLLGCFTTCD